MANALYPKWKETVMQAGANSSLAGTLKVSISEPTTLTIYEEGT